MDKPKPVRLHEDEGTLLIDCLVFSEMNAKAEDKLQFIKLRRKLQHQFKTGTFARSWGYSKGSKNHPA